MMRHLLLGHIPVESFKYIKRLRTFNVNIGLPVFINQIDLHQHFVLILFQLGLN